MVEAPQRVGTFCTCPGNADALLLFISRTNSRTLRQSSTSSSSSSQPPCFLSAWLHSSSTIAGLSLRTGRRWVCILTPVFRLLVADWVMAVRRFHADSVCVCSQRLCAPRCFAMVKIRVVSVWASARTFAKFLAMRANIGSSLCSPGKTCSQHGH